MQMFEHLWHSSWNDRCAYISIDAISQSQKSVLPALWWEVVAEYLTSICYSYPAYNHEKKSLSFSSNGKNYLCFATEVWKSTVYRFKNAFLSPLPTQYHFQTQKKKMKVLFFSIDSGVGERLGRWTCIRVWRACKSANLN